MARPKPSEPMVTVSVRMPVRLRDEMVERGDNVSASIVAACEAAVRPVAPQPAVRVVRSGASPRRTYASTEVVSSKDCRHPVTRRLGDRCAECGASLSTKGSPR